MAFRDDREALRAKASSLEEELDQSEPWIIELRLEPPAEDARVLP